MCAFEGVDQQKENLCNRIRTRSKTARHCHSAAARLGALVAAFLHQPGRNRTGDRRAPVGRIEPAEYSNQATRQSPRGVVPASSNGTHRHDKFLRDLRVRNLVIRRTISTSSGRKVRLRACLACPSAARVRRQRRGQWQPSHWPFWKQVKSGRSRHANGPHSRLPAPSAASCTMLISRS